MNVNLPNNCKNCTVSDSFVLSNQSQSSIPSPAYLSNPQVFLSQFPVTNNTPEKSSEPDYTNEIPIVNNFNPRIYLSPTKLPTSTPVSTPNIMPTFTDLDSIVRHLFKSNF